MNCARNKKSNEMAGNKVGGNDAGSNDVGSKDAVSPGGPPAQLRDPRQLCEVLEIPFSDEQLAAITAPLEPAVIIAAAGSGKTTVMAARVVWLVGTGQVRPDQVLGLTFTRKAAGELADRVSAALGKAGVVNPDEPGDGGEQVMMTYDAFAARLVRDHGLRVGQEPDVRMLSGAARFRMASRVVAEAPGPFPLLSRLRPDTLTERVLGLDEQMQQHLVDAKQIRDWHCRYIKTLQDAPTNRGQPYKSVAEAITAAGERLELLELVDRYRHAKQVAGVVEFADQMAVAARLAQNVPEVGRVLRQQFQVVLLDEYQDTSSAQALLLSALFGGDAGEEGRGHPVTAVGDPFQAIYGWRGAAPSNILQFAQDFCRKDGSEATKYLLTVNRRSDAAILSAANSLAEPLRADKRLQGGLGMDTSLRPAPGKPAGVVNVARFATWPQEVDWLADQVVAAHDGGEVDAWSKVAVLVRRNVDIAPLFEALTSRDVPVEIVGLGGLLNLAGIAEVVATLRLIDDVTANAALVALLSGPRWRIGPRDLAVLGRRARQLAGRSNQEPEADLAQELHQAVARLDETDMISLLDAVADLGAAPISASARARLERFRVELDELRTHRDEPVLELTQRVIGALGLAAELQVRETGGLTQLHRFTQYVADYAENDVDATLPGLLAWFDAELKFGTGLDQSTISAEDSVKLLTVHRAKGLEWDLVFLPALVAKTFPNDQVADNWITSAASMPAELRGDAAWVPQLGEVTNASFGKYAEELKLASRQAEDRLIYVAVTRARHRLVASAHCRKPGLVKQLGTSDYFAGLLVQAKASPGASGVLAQVPDDVPVPQPATDDAAHWPVPVDQEKRAAHQQVAEAVRHQLGQTSLVAGGGGVGTVDDAARLDLAFDEAADLPVPVDLGLQATQRQAAQAVRAQSAQASPAPADGLASVPYVDQQVSAALVRGTGLRPQQPQLSFDEQRLADRWALQAKVLVDEARQRRNPVSQVQLPASISASAALQAARDPKAFLRQIVRPMPRPASQVASVGTRFHEWLEKRFDLLAPFDQDDEDEPSSLDETSADKAFRRLCLAFSRSSYADRVPLAVEEPFVLVLDAPDGAPSRRLQVRGRIDAIYRASGDYDFQVVDWKTSDRPADAMQLALYRQAWADIAGVAPERVDAVFFHVASAQVQRPADLPDRVGIWRSLTPFI